MVVLSYERGRKQVIFDSAGTLSSGGIAINSLGDELWFMPLKSQSDLPEKFTWEIISSGTVTTGQIDLEATLGQQEGFSGPSVHGDRVASGVTWQQLTQTAEPAVTSLNFEVDKKVRALRIRLNTALTGGGRLIVAVST